MLFRSKCAFTSMGDWTYGEFAKAKMKDNEDFGWVSHPGTDGGFIIVADAFPLAKGAPHRQEVITRLNPRISPAMRRAVFFEVSSRKLTPVR